MAVLIAGRRFWLWRAVDDEGAIFDLLVQRRRDRTAAVKLMRKLLKKHGFAPDVLVSGQGIRGARQAADTVIFCLGFRLKAPAILTLAQPTERPATGSPRMWQSSGPNAHLIRCFAASKSFTMRCAQWRQREIGNGSPKFIERYEPRSARRATNSRV